MSSGVCIRLGFTGKVLEKVCVAYLNKLFYFYFMFFWGGRGGDLWVDNIRSRVRQWERAEVLVLFGKGVFAQ